MSSDSTTRFSSRVADYIAHRPSYPPAVVHLLASHFSLPPDAHILDIGSGTGILTKQLIHELSSPCPSLTVTGAEPNKDMRAAAEDMLAPDHKTGRFVSIDATAERTNLPDSSIDLIVAAQAFHWFDVPRARAEALRILKKTNGKTKTGAALIWNDRRGVRFTPEQLQEVGDDISKIDYEKLDSPIGSAFDLLLLKRGTDYKKVDHHRKINKAALDEYFGPKGFQVRSFENPYKLSYEQLEGRLLSSSYTPQKGEKGHEEMLTELSELFERLKGEDGKVDFVYDTRVFYGEISEG